MEGRGVFIKIRCGETEKMITAERIDKETYEKLFREYTICFDDVRFHQTVEERVDELWYVLFRKENKNKAGAVFGRKGKELRLHYSAPFGMIEVVKDHLKIEEYEEITAAVENLAKAQGVEHIFYRFPPAFYRANEINKLINVLMRQGYDIEEADLNYAIETKREEDFIGNLQRNARKNLNIALKNDLCLYQCSTMEEKEEAYQVIKRNREDKGFPLRMTWEQICRTIECVEADFYQVKIGENIIAAAMIYRVNPDIVQVVYWGDIREYAEFKPINYLAYMLNGIYAKQGITFIDIGPSTEYGVPNYGLCDFKESIGCRIDVKYTFIKQLRD